MRRKTAGPTEVRQVTARPVGKPFAVQQAGKVSFEARGDLDERVQVSEGVVQYGGGCYRRMPTNTEEI